jgi:glyoxylase-like metal-dependent hydrolase (beta-lactamase superfamily II)
MIRRWDIVVIGNLSRNRYWEESEERGVRGPLCTCTLITGDGFRLLVDPAFEDERAMADALDRRVGLKIDAIDLVFVTHEHGDHHAGVLHFPGAAWFAGAESAAAIHAAGKYAKTVEVAEGRLPEGIELLPTPGHTAGHCSLRFDCDGKSVVVAGDAAMTRDFWNDRRPFFNSADFEEARRSMERLAELADIVVPGHDNYFANR